MVLFNYATKEITAKIVYYGPGLCGKTTNLQFIYDSLPSNNRSKMLSLATKTEAVRQPRAGGNAAGRIELLPGKNFEHALLDLDGWEAEDIFAHS